MRAVNRFNVTHFWNPHVLRIPNWYGTCLVMKIFTIGLPAECGVTERDTSQLAQAGGTVCDSAVLPRLSARPTLPAILTKYCQNLLNIYLL